ncbi:MAG: DUF488 domain-containing protein [Candidatus Melainabacteria bacterium]|nr:DUF488 domain-containing protein [Candidatus Melainabacteria bacterium]
MSDYSLYTIGHSKHPIEKFIGLLKLHEINVVTDVRSHPMSRFNPQFNRKKLEAELQEHQISYVFLGDGLGGRPSGEQFYDEQGFILYHRIAQAEAFRTELGELIELSKTSRVSLMCSEEDPNSCHRKLLIGRALFKTENVTLNHIRGTGAIEKEESMSEQGVLDLPGFSDNWKSPKPLPKTSK